MRALFVLALPDLFHEVLSSPSFFLLFSFLGNFLYGNFSVCFLILFTSIDWLLRALKRRAFCLLLLERSPFES